MLTSHCTSCRCWIYTRSVSAVLWTCSWDSKMPHLCSLWFLIAYSTNREYFFFRKLIHETCQILATFDGKHSLLNPSKTNEIFYSTRMAFGSQKHIPERLKRLKWPLQCRQDSIIWNIYVVHSFNHVIVILGYNTREIVHTIRKEDSWICFLSFVFEGP